MMELLVAAGVGGFVEDGEDLSSLGRVCVVC